MKTLKLSVEMALFVLYPAFVLLIVALAVFTDNNFFQLFDQIDFSKLLEYLKVLLIFLT